MLSEGAVLEVETQHHCYTIVVRGRGQELISGHPQYCPDPVPVRIKRCTWGGSMLKLRFIGEVCGRNSGTPYIGPFYQDVRFGVLRLSQDSQSQRPQIRSPRSKWAAGPKTPGSQRDCGGRTFIAAPPPSCSTLLFARLATRGLPPAPCMPPASPPRAPRG